ncbi:hypothetical protein [Verrucomicrobium spinosum]|uniref:hypothetical protein n=1 Tax=Verrucomicrobium spinosum TaxID=2736 RepID=UPI000B050D27|nr:hypothetical protein [Verrucomicrobium spinosum]
MIEYLKICRPDHWLKNIFILFGHVVAWALVLDFQLDFGLVITALLSLIRPASWPQPTTFSTRSWTLRSTQSTPRSGFAAFLLEK